MRAFALFAVVFVAGCGSTSSGGPDGGICAATGECETDYPTSSPSHLPEPIAYSDRPPAGGPHSGCWTQFGVHATEVPDERWVHNLEHGAIVFAYQCAGGCPTEQAALEGLVAGRPFAVVVPYSEMTPRFAALAWGYRLLTDTLDVAAFVAFYDAHVDMARESSSANPPPTCP